MREDIDSTYPLGWRYCLAVWPYEAKVLETDWLWPALIALKLRFSVANELF